MPTLTFYVTDEVAEQFERVIKRHSKITGIKVSRGDVLSPHIKSLYRQYFPKNGNGKAHIVGQQTTPIITGELAGVMAGKNACQRCGERPAVIGDLCKPCSSLEMAGVMAGSGSAVEEVKS